MVMDVRVVVSSPSWFQSLGDSMFIRPHTSQPHPLYTLRPAHTLFLSYATHTINSGLAIHTTDIVQDVLSDRDDLYVKPGAEPPAKTKPTPSFSSSSSSSSSSATATTEKGTGLLRCKNYGCNQSFSEEANTESACRFHKAPPVFHDTKKGWACCTKRVYDWDEFHTVRFDLLSSSCFFVWLNENLCVSNWSLPIFVCIPGDS